MATVGIIVNPWAGKDVRRLHAPVGHTSDAAKVGSVHRIAAGALDAGADRVAVLRDTGRIAERALAGVAGGELIDGAGTGSALDTRRGATQLAAMGCLPIVVLGGDGTCRDVAIGAPHAAIIADLDGHQQRVSRRSSTARRPARRRDCSLAERSTLTPSAGRPRCSTSTSREADGTDRRTTSHSSIVALIDGSGVGARAVVRAVSGEARRRGRSRPR